MGWFGPHLTDLLDKSVCQRRGGREAAIFCEATVHKAKAKNISPTPTHQTTSSLTGVGEKVHSAKK